MIEVLRKIGFKPSSCVWELTLGCNLHCKHCGSYAGTSREDELSLEQCLGVADELAALGCQRVTLAGGEPTMHPDWHRIGRRLTDLGLRVNIISNGWRWTETHLEQARHARLVSVAFSLDGLEQDHDFMRREGSYARVIQAIDLSVDAGFPVAVNTTINNLNSRSLPELFSLLQDHGVFSWQLQFATPTGKLSEHPELVVRPEELLWLVPQIAALRRSDGPTKVLPADDVGYYGKCEQDLRDHGGKIPFWIGCRAGCHVVGIESNGNVKGCLSLPSAKHEEERFVEGNLLEAGLAAIWGREGAFAYNRQFSEDQLGGFCAVCRYRDFCRGGCSWTAFGHTGDRFDNPYCFYRQAVEHGRLDLLAEDPTPLEQDYFTRTQAPTTTTQSDR
jgi:radical SAM protein with 4Fe4S-binding SPASM domain